MNRSAMARVPGSIKLERPEQIVARADALLYLHVARPDYAPTEGCIALAVGDLRRLLSAGLTELMVLPP